MCQGENLARINIEQCIWTDHRFINLCMKTGNIDQALGSLVRAWMIAQQWYLKDDRLIPSSEWEKQNLPEALFEVGLASRNETGRVRMAGSEEQFGWLLQRSEAGKRGGGSNRKKGATVDASRSTESNVRATSFSFSKNNTNTFVGILTNYPQEFEKVWKQYKRRGDKKAAFIEFKKLKLNEEGLENLSQAIKNYINSLSELKYAKHLERFLKTDWREFLDGSHSYSAVNLKRVNLDDL